MYKGEAAVEKTMINGIEIPRDGEIRNGIIFKKDVGGEWWLCFSCSLSSGGDITGIYHQAGKSCDKMAPR